MAGLKISGKCISLQFVGTVALKLEVLLRFPNIERRLCHTQYIKLFNGNIADIG